MANFLIFLVVPWSHSFKNLFAQMGWVAKLILLILVLFSIVSWAVMIYKYRIFLQVKKESRRFLSWFRSKRGSLDAYASFSGIEHTPLAKMLGAGLRELEEYRLHQSDLGQNLVKTSNPGILISSEVLENIKNALERTNSEEIENLGRYIVFLATVGNVSPFLGLLGTIWGVMEAFMNIGIRGSASLAVVAPGIAQALIATIVGLAAAIPAVVGYNYFTHKLRVLAVEQDNFALELMNRFRREHSE